MSSGRRAGPCLIAIGAVLLLAAPPAASAGAGPLDLSFGDEGMVLTDFTDDVDTANAVAIQADGKIVAVGTAGPASGFALARYNPDGSLDGTFDGDGRVTTGTVPDGRLAEALDVAIQPVDQKLVVAGYAIGPDGSEDFAVARYNPDGSLDSAFGGGDGTVLTQFAAPPDPTVDNDRAEAVAIDGDGRIVAAGYGDPSAGGIERDFAVARYDSNGALDATFGGDGKVTQGFQGTEVGQDVVLRPGGSILVGGSTQAPGSLRNFAFVQFESDGDRDPAFHQNGVAGFGFGSPAEVLAMGLQPDGKIVAAGRLTFAGTDVALIARYTPDGNDWDTSFGNQGDVKTVLGGDGSAWNDVAVRADGAILAAGYSDTGIAGRFAVGRYLSGGQPDGSFGCKGIVTTGFGNGSAQASGMALAGGDRTVAAGNAGPSFGIARYLSGSPDCKAPKTKIRGPSRTRNHRPKFKLRPNEPGSTFVCSVDLHKGLEPCSATYRPEQPLRPGDHVLYAQATDATGNEDKVPALKSFRIVGKRN